MSKYAGFTSTQLTRPKRSQFDLSHEKRLSTRMGRLTPVFVSEAIPGDTFRGNIEILLRLAPLLAPIYDMITLYVHVFFIPYRLLWKEWETFITGGRLGVGIDPLDAPLPPYFTFNDIITEDPTFFGKSQLLDYLGMPIITALPGYSVPSYNGAKFELLVPMGYQKVYMDYYRDRNFVADDYITFPQDSGQLNAGSEASSYLSRRFRSYEQDYFTSALPFTQRGEEVLMPLAGTGSVTYLDSSYVRNSDDNTPPIGGMYGTAQDSLSFGSGYAGTDGVHITASDNGAPGTNLQIRNIDQVLLESSSVSINDFRSAYALQVWLERNAVAGSRYNESTEAHFGVRPQDSRLQRAEYLGGGRIPVKISEVVSTAYSENADANTIPLANMAGHGVSYGNTNMFNYFCPEHGVIMGIASVMSPPSYHQGMPRWFLRSTFLDYPWPTFARLGEQPVNKYELFASGPNLVPDDAGEFPLFGYQSRYADWKSIHSTNHGDFHDSLLFWTLTRNFGSSPVLSETFTTYDSTVQNRIFAVNGTADNVWLYVHNNVTVNRCLPYFGSPNTMGF